MSSICQFVFFHVLEDPRRASMTNPVEQPNLLGPNMLYMYAAGALVMALMGLADFGLDSGLIWAVTVLVYHVQHIHTYLYEE